jgi:hypothetical protein
MTTSICQCCDSTSSCGPSSSNLHSNNNLSLYNHIYLMFNMTIRVSNHDEYFIITWYIILQRLIKCIEYHCHDHHHTDLIFAEDYFSAQSDLNRRIICLNLSYDQLNILLPMASDSFR